MTRTMCGGEAEPRQEGGPNIESSDGAGTNTSSVPSAVAVALFAFLATWVIAKYAYGRKAEPER